MILRHREETDKAFVPSSLHKTLIYIYVYVYLYMSFTKYSPCYFKAVVN